MANSLRDFLNRLEMAGELLRVSASVSPILEISQIADRQSKAAAPSISAAARWFDPLHADRGGHALLFEKVEGCDFPLAINVFGSYRRMEMALGCEGPAGFGAIADRLAALTRPEPPAGLRDLLGKARQFMPLLRTPPRTVRSGPSQEVVKLTERGEVDLARLPLIKCWPLDGDPGKVGFGTRPEEARTAGGDGRYITFAGMHTVHADDDGVARPASHNVGMYRAQLVDATHLAMHWHLHHDGAAHWRSWKSAGRAMPIAICLGGEPVLPYAATAPLPPGVSELLMAGFLNGRGIPMVAGKTVPLRVPANAEFVIEGYVSTECGDVGFDPRTDGTLGAGAVLEGPFGDHTGFYSLPDRYPLLEVTAVTHRRNPVFPATIVGYPPQEDYYLGKATERIFLPLLQMLVPDIVDYHLPQFGAFHNCAFIKIRKEYALQARRVMHAVWGAGQMAWTKMIVVVDEDVILHDERAVFEAMALRCDFLRDVELTRGPLDILDHAAPYLGAGGKIGFDATRALPGEDAHGVAHDAAMVQVRTDEVSLKVSDLVGRGPITDAHAPAEGRGRIVLLAVDKTRPGQGAEAIELALAEPEGDLIVVVGPEIDLRDHTAVWFHLCANLDPLRDLHRRERRLALDGTPKMPGDERGGCPVRDWPPFMAMDPGMVAQVERRWPEYGFEASARD